MQVFISVISSVALMCIVAGVGILWDTLPKMASDLNLLTQKQMFNYLENKRAIEDHYEEFVAEMEELRSERNTLAEESMAMAQMTRNVVFGLTERVNDMAKKMSIWDNRLTIYLTRDDHP